MSDWVIFVFESKIGQALFIAAVTAIVARIWQRRGKLLWAVSHQHHYRMPRIDEDGSFPVITQQVWFQNVGRSPIEEVEVVLNFKPQHYEIWEPRQWATDTLPDGRMLLKIPSLNSQEGFSLSMIDTFSELPLVVKVRWKGGVGKNVRMAPQQVQPAWFLWCLLILILIGITAILYWLLQVALHLFAHP